MMKRLLFLLFAVALSASVIAQPAHYYDAAQGLTGEPLRQALHDIIKGHDKLTYAQLWYAFWSTDNKGNGIVWDMYSDVPGGTPAYEYELGVDQCGNYHGEGDCYNREHSWPQSWFNNDGTARTDLHHIFPTDGWVNGQRDNFPYGEVGSASYTFTNGAKLGACKTPGYTGKVYEPIDEYKGDLARALMYMSVRYYHEDDDWDSSGMTEKSDLKPWAIALLLRWHEADPVSQKEIDRNNVIYEDYQSNRNPFVDHPDFAFRIWDPNWSDYCVDGVDALQDYVYPNPVHQGGEIHFLRMNWPVDKVLVCDLSGRAMLQMCVTNETDFTLSLPENLQRGFYTLLLQKEGRAVGHLKLIVK